VKLVARIFQGQKIQPVQLEGRVASSVFFAVDMPVFAGEGRRCILILRG